MKKSMRKLLIIMLAGCFVFAGGCASKIKNAAPPENNAEDKPSVPTSEQLMSADYAFNPSFSDYISDEPGLRNPFIIGVDSRKRDNKRLVTEGTSVLLDGGLLTDSAVVFDAATYGAAANDKLNDALAIQNAIKAAKAADEGVYKILRLPKGRIDIVEGTNGVNTLFGLVFEGLKNFVFDGNGADIIFGSFQGFNGMLIKDCENFGLTNFTLDYANPPFMMGKIVSMDMSRRIINVRIDEGYRVDPNVPITQYIEYDPISKLPRYDTNCLVAPPNRGDLIKSEYIKNGDGSYNALIYSGSPLAPMIAGTPVSLCLTYYGAHVIESAQNKNVAIEGVSVYSSWGMTVCSTKDENLIFNRFENVIKPGTGRLFGTSADILHLANTKGTLDITNCTLENAWDDGVNILGHMFYVYDIDTHNKTIEAMFGNGAWGNVPPELGDVMEVAERETLKVTAKLTVSGVTDTGTYIILSFEETDNGSVPMSVLTKDSMLSNVTRSPKVLFENNVVRNMRTRGLLLQSRHSIVRNNFFGNILEGAIQLFHEGSVFHESLRPEDILIENNKFLFNSSKLSYGDIHLLAAGDYSYNRPAPDCIIKDIRITNNFFGRSYGVGIGLRSASEILIEHNQFFETAHDPFNPAISHVLYMNYVDDVTVRKNKVERTEDDEFIPVMIASQTADNSVRLEDNIGLSTESGALPVTRIYKQANGAIAIDGSLNDWAGIEQNVVFKSAQRFSNPIPADGMNAKVSAKITYTEEGLYFGVKVSDDVILFPAAGDWWTRDFVEIFLSGNTTHNFDTEVMKIDPDFAAVEFMQIYASNWKADFYDLRTSLIMIPRRSSMQYAMTPATDGYIFELFLPFTMIPDIGAKLKAGGEAAYSLTVSNNDDDDGAHSDWISNVKHNQDINKMTPKFMARMKAAG